MRILTLIPIQGRGFINQGSTLSCKFRGPVEDCKVVCIFITKSYSAASDQDFGGYSGAYKGASGA